MTLVVSKAKVVATIRFEHRVRGSRRRDGGATWSIPRKNEPGCKRQ
jgi:hypothetical protein